MHKKRSKHNSLEDVVSAMFNESTVQSIYEPSTDFHRELKPNKSRNKVTTPKDLKNDPNGTRALVNIRNKKRITSKFEEDEESVDERVIIENAINQVFETNIAAKTNGIILSQLIKLVRPLVVDQTDQQIVFVIQLMITDNKLRYDTSTKRISLYEEDEEDYIEPNDLTDNSVEDIILNYMNSTTSGSVSGIKLSQIINDVTNTDSVHGKYGHSEVVTGIKDLLRSGQITPGIGDGTLMINSSYIDGNDENNDADELIDFEDVDGMDFSEDEFIEVGDELDEDEENAPVITNAETEETLKSKGWRKENNGIYTSPSGQEKCVIAQENKNYNLNNNIMTYNTKFEQLLKEFDEAFDSDEFDSMDDTEGLDEFSDDMDEGTEGDVTITFTADEVNLLRDIIAKIDGGDEELEDDLLEDDVLEDEEIDDDFDSLDEEDEECEDEEDEEDDVDFEEDEETLADSNNSVYDGSFTNGAPTLNKKTPAYDPKRKPLQGPYKNSNTGSVHDGSGRNGGPSMSRSTPTYDPKRKPVPSRQTTKAGKNESYFA